MSNYDETQLNENLLWRDLGLKTWHNVRNPYMYIQRILLKRRFTFTDELQLLKS